MEFVLVYPVPISKENKFYCPQSCDEKKMQIAYSIVESNKTFSQLRTLKMQSDDDVYWYCNKSNYAVICLTKKQIEQHVMEALFQQLYSGLVECESFHVAPQKLLNNWFGKIQSGTQEKIISLNKDIDDVKLLMTDAIDKALERGDNIDKIAEKSNILASQANAFSKKSTDLKREMCMRNWKLVFMITGSLLFIILLMILVVKTSKN